ncbi:hypothetical protein GCM10007320_36000 [Pseudorhodoferax aquiterrae]|uniref:Uncharacterized protein n=1 Tax=Pseudorhodoferax aquiterrae TaxID=747304 RepID=A0ABQ3G449_9BURK|nr:hypothetical protein GCM10007320_36000 [Pseudorhodoferax aquiterrae]
MRVDLSAARATGLKRSFTRMDKTMALKTTDFTIHGASRFPLVLATADAPPGYAARWPRSWER